MSEQEPAMCTTSGRPVDEVRAEQTETVGQHKDYIVLCPDERAKGFVRPVRTKYTHVGNRPQNPTRELTADEKERYGQFGYVQYEEYPPSETSVTGRFWTQQQLKSGCGVTTYMGTALAETYARDPKFYGATFCVHCNRHLPVAEFVWEGTDERVGS
jgi:hypothetical protein